MRRVSCACLFAASLTLLPFSGSLGSVAAAQVAAEAATPPENPEVQDRSARLLHAQVLELFHNGQYGQIDLLANQLRTERLRFRGGAWQLQTLYSAIDSPGSMTEPDEAFGHLFDRLNAWIAASPTSPTPRIALAKAYTEFAWKARGNGYANTITKDGFAKFTERIQTARSTLEAARPMSTQCPEWYRVMETVALAQGWTRKDIDSLIKTATTAEPEYQYIATAHANYLLPKWYGRPGEAEAYAAQVADAAGGRQGDALYFLIASSVNCCRRPQAPALDEARVQRGFVALDQLYGSTNHQRNAAAFLALQAGDNATAQTLFARIGDDWSARVWGSKARFDASRTGQPVGNTQPVGPQSHTLPEGEPLPVTR